jgi:hypothetical protein
VPAGPEEDAQRAARRGTPTSAASGHACQRSCASRWADTSCGTLPRPLKSRRLRAARR